MVTPARIRWERDAATGARPDALEYGSMSVNMADKKVYVGDAGDVPVRFTQWVDDWNVSLTYDQGDYVIRDDSIWRARTDIPSQSGFNLSEWQRLSAGALSETRDFVSSDIISGGNVSLSGSDFTVTSGRGIVINNATGETTILEWDDITITLSDPGAVPWTVLAFNAAGTLGEFSSTAWTDRTRRENIVVAYVLWSGGSPTEVIKGSMRTAGDAETIIDVYLGARKKRGLVLKGTNVDLSTSVTDGEVFAMGYWWADTPLQPNTRDLTGITPNFERVISIGTTGTTSDQLDPENWDNGGVLTSVPAGDYTIQYLFMNPDGTQFWAQYGQTVYDSFDAAASAVNEDWQAFNRYPPSWVSLLLGAVILQQGATDTAQGVVDASEGRTPFGGGGGNTVDTERFYLLDGSRPLTGDMDAAGFEITDTIIDGGTGGWA